MCHACYTEDQNIAADAYAEGVEDAYIPTVSEEEARRREYLAYARERFGEQFYIEPDGYGLHVQCRRCWQTAVGQLANTMIYEHSC